jgi:hypothetical protein
MSKKIKYWLIGLFVITRVYIWVSKPIEFTDVVHNFMAYAHLWASGDRPYLDQWYEYPPGTIPLFYLPHLIDVGTLGDPWHLDYAQSYRGIMLVTDLLLFWLIWKVLEKRKVGGQVFVTALIYYSLITAKAHHFMYDKIDLMFAAASVFGVVSPILVKKERVSSFLAWWGYFVSVALKLVNIPLGLVYALTQRKDIKRLILGMTAAFIVTLALPILYYRSSLLVIYEYHKQRGLQVESVPAVISLTVNKFTNTENFAEVYKNYDVVGPISEKVKKVYDVVFPGSLILFLWYATKLILKNTKKTDRFTTDLYLSVGYIFVFMLTSKVLSTPFLLWHIPFLAVYPFKRLSTQLKFLIPSFVIIASSMTKIPDLSWGLVNLHLVIGWIRSGLFLWILYSWLKHRSYLTSIN